MIIHNISAENVLKYERLDLGDLPGDGIIAISGANESGKSTIGETVCFALFGRTFSLGPDEIHKLIRWGESRCSANLVFSNGEENAKHYEIARVLDVDGNHGVRLNLVGEEGTPIARGTRAVGDALVELIGYQFDEFIESFYLAQREITTPHPHSQAVKIMAGIAPLETVSQAFSGEIRQSRSDIEARQQSRLRVEAELEELAVRQGGLQELESRHQSLVAEQVRQKAQVEELQTASSRYQDNLPRLQAAGRARALAGFWRFVFLVPALLAGGLWYVLAQLPESNVARTVTAFLDTRVSPWSPDYIPWLLYAALGSAVLFVFFWVRRVSLSSRIRQLRETAGELADLLGRLPEEIKVATGDRLHARIADLTADAEEVHDGVAGGTERTGEQMDRRQEDIERLEQQIQQETERLSRAALIEEERAAYQEQIERAEHGIRVRELGRELLLGASRQISRRFNRDLRELVGRTLPLFTEDRYQHLQIGDDLTVRVFSSEKRDFMDLEEISSGTQRQIMLAVRLALSQELVNSTVTGKQFIFLDEPFAFFDHARTRSALAVLPKLSDEITQVWIIAQEFPAEAAFDTRILCSREYHRLPPVRE